jgi:hypothetical protein
MDGSRVNPKDCSVRAVELDIESKRYPEIARALAYWRAKRGARLLPSRADIDPLDLSPDLPRIMMAEVNHDPLEFRYRVAGTGTFRVHGEELTGKRPHDLQPAEFGKLIHNHYCEAAKRRTPILHLIQLNVGDVATSYARIILPLASDGATVDRLLTLECYEDHLDDLQRFFEESQD